MNSNISLFISVRELAEFVWRAGDLKHRRDGPSALEGAKAHRRLQKARLGYQSEVALSQQVSRDQMTLTVSGRADLVSDEGPEHIVEEIKTTLQSPLLIDGNNPVHWAQVKLYGHMYAVRHQRETLNLQVTYLNPETDALRTFSKKMTAASMAAFFEETTNVYIVWMAKVTAWRQTRNDSLASLRFPFDAPRPGQEQLAASVAALSNENKKLFIEAPTGSGKTMAVLWGATRALKTNAVSQLLFLTARSLGRGAAQSAGELLQSQGARLKVLCLYARNVLCTQTPDTGCSGDECALAKGHFNRIRGAINDLFDAKNTDRETVAQVAKSHRVCPYWLSRTMLPYVDLVVGDYNYFFDPGATLLTLTAPTSPPRLLLVDEAHNLPDRARQMFSATLRTERLAMGTRDIDKAQQKNYTFARRCLKELIHAIDKVGADFNAHQGSTEPQTVLETGLPEPVNQALENVIDAISASLALFQGQAQGHGRIPGNLLQVYFDCLAFSRAVSDSGDGAKLILTQQPQGVSITSFCVDPAPKLKQVFENSKALGVFFSATLSPAAYYRRILGGDDSDQYDVYPPHFKPSHRCIARSVNISTRYRDRTHSRHRVAALIRATVLARPGNYLAFFPSFAYLSMVADALDFETAKVDMAKQRPGLSDRERQAFLNKFRTKRRTRHLLGLAVLGGLFSEAVDLPGHELIGAMVVSPGLPKVSFEQSLIRDHYEQTDGRGFDYAYTYPGMNKVIQAAGRVHRSTDDQGVVLFIGQRFAERSYAPLLETRWPEIVDITNDTEWRDMLNNFWRK